MSAEAGSDKLSNDGLISVKSDVTRITVADEDNEHHGADDTNIRSHTVNNINTNDESPREEGDNGLIETKSNEDFETEDTYISNDNDNGSKDNNNSEESDDEESNIDIMNGGEDYSEDYSGDDSDDDSDDESDGDKDDNDTEPPLLKFSRIKNFFEDLPKRDAISTCFFGTDYFAFGTHMGLLHITKADFSKVRTIKCHRSSILSIYIEGATIATASIDGTIVIGSLSDSQNLIAYDFKRPVNAVVLHHNYETSKIFISGGMAGEVILTQKNWLGNRSDITLEKNNGPIVGIFIVDDILIWMNDGGITFNDIPSKTTLLKVVFPSQSEVERPDLFKPFMHKIDRDRIVIGWGRHLWSFKLTASNSLKNESAKLGSIISSAASSLRVTPERNVEKESHYVSDLFLAGIASFKGDQLMCLGFSASQGENKLRGCLPELSIIDLLDMSEVYSNEIVTKNYQSLNLNDYHLGMHIANNLPEYYLICTEDRIKINTLSLYDHYLWYKEKKNLAKAWELGKLVLNPSDIFDLGVEYVQKLTANDNWESAAQMSISVFSVVTERLTSGDNISDSVPDWKLLFSDFLKSENADILAAYLPQQSSGLPVSIYEATLECLLKKNKLEIFQEIVVRWPIEDFELTKIEQLLEDMKESIDDKDKKNSVLSSLITINLAQERFSKAVPYMIDIKDTRIFQILRQYKLTSHFLSRLMEIILIPFEGDIKDIEKLSRDQIQSIFQPSFEFIIGSIRVIKLQYLIDTFNSEPDLEKLELYTLEYIFDSDSSLSINYEDLLIRLLAKYERKKLLSFLKIKHHYDVRKAITVCKNSKDLYHELIYLWGKVGETKRALSLIIDELKDPDLAIHFVKSWGDPELIDFLISYSMDKPNFIRALLESVDESRVLHLEVIKNLPENLEIAALPQVLNKVTKEVNLDFTVQRTIDGIIEDDTQRYAVEWLKYRIMGKIFDVI
ncbi:Vacuolar protein sorting-associated protein 41 [Nakaseomyces bracarensis]|uniref:Vacuolar protein sorting-associated protein 41 n=1 Tax=Nakaseomyces bracarensis TaxID=273131 RepID=A0ABR4NXS8_9SACH